MDNLSKQLIDYFISILGESNVLVNEPMKNHTTFQIGGPADCFLQVSNLEQLQVILKCIKQTEYEFMILGNGSNVLVSDQGYEGIVLALTGDFKDLQVSGNDICAGAGATLKEVANYALANSLTGFEFAAGIPGTVGGGVLMNAGAYGGEMCHVVKSVTVINFDGEVFHMSKGEMEFGYRKSAVMRRPFLILSVVFELSVGVKEEILDKITNLNQQRKDKQPLEYPSAGSTFKRPKDYYAGKLIMDSGLRGFRVGGAMISEKHCGFVINYDNASAQDVSDLMTRVCDKVEDCFGVRLEPEVIRIGRF